MEYFNINIDNDITYLLQEIGHSVKVNNIMAKAIINNSSMEKTYDDKKIITHEPLKRGHYINYNDLNFMLLNEVNDKRYLSYYKGVMRACNFDIKFIIGSRLYLFHSIIESDKFALNQSQFITLSADTITVTLPSTVVTEQIELDMRFISMGRVWKINGLDKTKVGLINLICKINAHGLMDDMENEIANRFVGELDKLKGNITPIMPFDEVVDPEPIDPEEPGDTTAIEITGLDEITIWDKNIEYSVNTTRPVLWTLNREDIIKFMSKVDDKCYIQGVSTSKIGESVLRCTLVENADLFVEKTISLVYQ